MKLGHENNLLTRVYFCYNLVTAGCHITDEPSLYRLDHIQRILDTRVQIDRMSRRSRLSFNVCVQLEAPVQFIAVSTTFDFPIQILK